jgi:hypothetical protein
MIVQNALLGINAGRIVQRLTAKPHLQVPPAPTISHQPVPAEVSLLMQLFAYGASVAHGLSIKVKSTRERDSESLRDPFLRPVDLSPRLSIRPPPAPKIAVP